MGDIVSFLLDVILIGLLLTGIVYAMRLSKQLADLRNSRSDMQKFVTDFSSTVQRAEAGVRGLKQAARDGGDDLERLIEKATLIRDELHFLVGSADHIATRLSDTAASATRGDSPRAATPKPDAAKKSQVSASQIKVEKKTGAAATSAERELMRALEKLG